MKLHKSKIVYVILNDLKKKWDDKKKEDDKEDENKEQMKQANIPVEQIKLLQVMSNKV